MNSKARLRARIILLGFVVCGCAIVASLYDIQVLKGGTYSRRADTQYARPSVSVFDRGTIYFSSKDGTRIAAAGIDKGYFLYANPRMITDVAQAQKALSTYSVVDPALFNKVARSTSAYIELAHKLPEETAVNIRDLKINGIGVAKEAWRTYPGDELAAQTLGIIGQDASSTVKGRYGLERSYDRILTREHSVGSSNTFASLFNGLDTVFGTTHDDGDIVTTIEPSVEAYLTKVLSDTRDQWKPDSIGGIVMDPHTGEIVALAHVPSFNPNNTSHIKDVSVLSNPLIEHVYEMGSIIKPLTMAVGLDSGAIKRNTTYDDTGCATIDKKKICNYDGKARGITPMQEILSQSLNMGAAYVALQAGKDVMSRYFTAFGLGTTTGIDLPNEATGLIGNLTKKGQDIDVATASYGQGIALSPVETIRALAVLANGGYVVTPHVTKSILYTDGGVTDIDWPKQGPVLKEKTVSDVVDMLTTVVDTKLANGKVKMDRYSIAAKTGTAEIADHANGGYYKDRYLHSFFGFFPAKNPKYIVFLYQIYPKGAKYASETLVEPFVDMTKFLISYYNITPDR